MKLGQRVSFKRILRRVRGAGGTWRWLPEESRGVGLLIGLRNLQIGKVIEESDYDEFSGKTYRWREWQGKGTTPAALVVTDLYRKPVYIPREELTRQGL